MDLQAMPESCKVNVISVTTPRYAGRLSLISKSFKSAADSDAVWDEFLPPGINDIIQSDPENAIHAKSKKELFFTLCDNSILMSFSLDKRSGKKCYIEANLAHWLSIIA